MTKPLDFDLSLIETWLESWPSGYHQGHFAGRRYGVTIERPLNGRVTKVYAEALDESDIVSFNLFHLVQDRSILKPCEISTDKVIQFVSGVVLDKHLLATT